MANSYCRRHPAFFRLLAGSLLRRRARCCTSRAMSHGHDHKQEAHAHGDKGAYPHLSKLEVEKLGNFGDGQVLEASKWASVNDPHPTGTLQSPALLAMSKVLGTACVEYNAAFFECKARTRNPEKCEKEGIAVTGCAKNVYVVISFICAPHSCSQFATCSRALPTSLHCIRELPQL